jgi:hypothetical protein
MESDTTPPTLRPCPANASVQEEFGWISEWLRHHQLFTTLDALLDEGMQLLDLNVAKIVEPPVSAAQIRSGINIFVSDYYENISLQFYTI